MVFIDLETVNDKDLRDLKMSINEKRVIKGVVMNVIEDMYEEASYHL